LAQKPLPSKDLPPSPTTLLPFSRESSQFFTFFPCWWNFIYADVPPYGTSPSWYTQTRYPLEARNAWSAYHDPDVLLGVRFGVKTHYFLFDIDWGSSYHPAQSLSSYKHLIDTMEEAGFSRYTSVLSSESGGLHLYFALPQEVSTSVLAEAIHLLLTEKDMTIADGTLEVFPAPKSADALYKAHRLPLQRGSYVLDPETFEPRHQSIEMFLRELAFDREGQDEEAIGNLLSRIKVVPLPTKAVSLFSTTGKALEADLLTVIAQGWTGYHQTNHQLWKIAMYGRIFLKLSDTALTSYIVETAKASPGYHEFCRHQHEIEKRARDWMRFGMKHYYPYKEWRERDTRLLRSDFRNTALGIGILGNNITPQEKTHEETLARVRYVVEELKESGKLPQTATGRIRAIQEKLRGLLSIGISLETLYKECYRPLWHPSYEERFETIPDPWDEPLKEDGVMTSNEDGERDYGISPNRYMLLLPPAREDEAGEECAQVDSEELSSKTSIGFQTTKRSFTSITTITHNDSLSANSGARHETDKEGLSMVDTRTCILPRTWCRVVRGNTPLTHRSSVLIDSISPDGKTVTVISDRGVIISGIPPDVLEPE